MIRLNLKAQTLGNTGFAISPIAEVGLSIRLLNGMDPASHPHGPWFRTVRPRLRSVDMELLPALAPRGRWIASCLTPPPTRVDTTFEDQLSELERLPHAQLAEQFGDTWAAHPPPSRVQDRLRDPRAFAIIAEELGSYWEAAISPFWPRMRAVLEDDIAVRAGHLASGRMFDMLSGLHEELSIEGDTMVIDRPSHADQDCEAERLMLAPAIFAWPRLIVELRTDSIFSITYWAAGAARAWNSSAAREDPDHTSTGCLSALLGRGRSAVLAATSTPRTTTQIAGELGKSPATVSEHLSVLRRSGLVSPRRAGRRVLYWQTPLGESLVIGMRSRYALATTGHA